MARYIDADKADVERISCFYGAECRLEDVQEWLDEQPTADVVKVVRCKDCIHYDDVGECEIHSYDGRFNVNYFCADGERRRLDGKNQT